MSGSPDKSRPVGNDGTVLRCPLCRNVLPSPQAAAFPFCSDRCRLLDLNNWLDGKYTMSRPIDPTDQAADGK